MPFGGWNRPAIKQSAPRCQDLCVLCSTLSIPFKLSLAAVGPRHTSAMSRKNKQQAAQGQAPGSVRQPDRPVDALEQVNESEMDAIVFY